MRKPPSRIKYELSHPVIPIRVSLEVYQKLQNARLNGQSYADIVRIGLGVQEATNKELVILAEQLQIENFRLKELEKHKANFR
jgi:predicted CopG family antitoxin